MILAIFFVALPASAPSFPIASSSRGEALIEMHALAASFLLVVATLRHGLPLETRDLNVLHRPV